MLFLFAGAVDGDACNQAQTGSISGRLSRSDPWRLSRRRVICFCTTHRTSDRVAIPGGQTHTSLHLLRTDYLDLYLAHAFDAETPIEETLEALEDARRAGKMRYAGASNYPAWRLVEALWKAETHHTLRFDCLEPHYNLVHRAEFERDVQAICQQYQIAVMPYSPLANGFLTGKYRREQGGQQGQPGGAHGGTCPRTADAPG